MREALMRGRKAALLCAVVGGVLCVAGALLDRREFFIAYLYAYLFWLGLSLGCLVLAMIHHLTAGRWGEVTRRFQEAGFMALPAMTILFVPLLFGLRELYPWARPAEVAADAVLQKRGAYASGAGFVIRAAVMLGVWNWMAFCLRRWSLQQDVTTDLAPTRKLRKLSGAGVVIYTMTATIAYVDWLMSLEPHWYSTMFPIIVCIGQILSALAFSILAVAWSRRFEPWAAVVGQPHLRQLGNLLLAFVLFWTYVSFGQLLIVYPGNLPQEIEWYLHRIGGSWKWAVGAIALFHFFLPFYALLFRPVSRSVTRLSLVAGVVFATGLLDAFWQVTPTFYPKGFHLDWIDIAAPVGIGGVWMAVFCGQLAKENFLPRNDPRMSEELAHAR